MEWTSTQNFIQMSRPMIHIHHSPTMKMFIPHKMRVFGEANMDPEKVWNGLRFLWCLGWGAWSKSSRVWPGACVVWTSCQCQVRRYPGFPITLPRYGAEGKEEGLNVSKHQKMASDSLIHTTLCLIPLSAGGICDLFLTKRIWQIEWKVMDGLLSNHSCDCITLSKTPF